MPNNITPFEIWFGYKFNSSYFKFFGYPTHVLIH